MPTSVMASRTLFEYNHRKGVVYSCSIYINITEYRGQLNAVILNTCNHIATFTKWQPNIFQRNGIVQHSSDGLQVTIVIEFVVRLLLP